MSISNNQFSTVVDLDLDAEELKEGILTSLVIEEAEPEEELSYACE